MNSQMIFAGERLHTARSLFHLSLLFLLCVEAAEASREPLLHRSDLFQVAVFRNEWAQAVSSSQLESVEQKGILKWGL